jgi:hypothetical protein
MLRLYSRIDLLTINFYNDLAPSRLGTGESCLDPHIGIFPIIQFLDMKTLKPNTQEFYEC